MRAEEEELARRRLALLQRAQDLGNVSEACREYGISRRQFYKYKKRYEDRGLEGLVDLPPVHESHPMTTPKQIQQKVIEKSLAHPAWGCDRISDLLKREGHSVSGNTTQKILKRNGLRTRHDRWLKLEDEIFEGDIELSAEQVAFIEERNPCFRHRHTPSSRPGQILHCDMCLVGPLNNGGQQVYLRALVDTYSNSAFCELGFYTRFSRQWDREKRLLQHAVGLFNKRMGFRVETMVTYDRRAVGVAVDIHNDDFLYHHKIRRRVPDSTERTSGFVERFTQAAKEEFLLEALQGESYESIEALKKDFYDWLRYYHTERPYHGYPNMGRSPIERIEEYFEGRTE